MFKQNTKYKIKLFKILNSIIIIKCNINLIKIKIKFVLVL